MDSLVAKLNDPYFNAKKLKEGTLVLEVDEKEIDIAYRSDEKLREKFDQLRDESQSVWDIGEDEEQLRYELFEEMHKDAPIMLERFQEVLLEELQYYKEGSYDEVADIRDAFHQSLKKPLFD